MSTCQFCQKDVADGTVNLLCQVCKEADMAGNGVEGYDCLCFLQSLERKITAGTLTAEAAQAMISGLVMEDALKLVINRLHIEGVDTTLSFSKMANMNLIDDSEASEQPEQPDEPEQDDAPDSTE